MYDSPLVAGSCQFGFVFRSNGRRYGTATSSRFVDAVNYVIHSSNYSKASSRPAYRLDESQSTEIVGEEEESHVRVPTIFF